jgi:hypothetical protein
MRGVDEHGETIRAPAWSGPLGRSYEHWLLIALALAGLVALLVLGLFVKPDPRGYGTHEQLGLPSCKPMEWWGIPCPGCGVTTSVALAARGHLWASIHNQPFGFLVACGIPLFAIWCAAHHFRGRDLHTELKRMKLLWWGAIVATVMLFGWVYKLALIRHWIS